MPDRRTNRPGRAESAGRTRARILECARERFERHGFDDAGIRDIAADAGVAAGTVFVHFADKLDLLYAALHEDLERTAAAALMEIPPGPFVARAVHVAGAFFDYYERRPDLSRVLLRESLVAQGPWAKAFVDLVGRVHGVVAALVEEAQAAGELTEDADPGLVALAFVSFFQFAVLSWVQQAHPHPRGWVETLLRQHVAGMMREV